MSQTSASSHPPPSAKPDTAAISGVLHAAIRFQNPDAGWTSASWKLRSRSPLMSAPAANTFSDPAITMQRASGSASQDSIASASSNISSAESAFRASGRLRRQSATALSREVSMKLTA